jgi:hypothetical protein
MLGVGQEIANGLDNTEMSGKLKLLFSKIELGELRPGLSQRVYNRLKGSGKFGEFSLSDLRGILDASSWEESFEDIYGLAGMGLAEIQALANFFQFVDVNFPKGVPSGTFKIEAETNRLVVDNLVGRPTLPIFWPEAALALRNQTELVLVPAEELEKAQEETFLLRKYFGLELEAKVEEEHYEENLKRYLDLGREIFQQLDFTPQAVDRLSTLAESFGFFDFFFIQGDDGFLLLDEIKTRRNRVGIATLQTYVELVLGVDEIFPP